MSDFVEKISKIKSTLESQHGKFDLFCMVELEDFEGQWDIVASAAWLPSSEAQALSLLIDYLHDSLSEEELLQILGVVVLCADEPFVAEVLALPDSVLDNIVISGLSVKSIHILSERQNRILSIQEKLAKLGFTSDEYNLIERFIEILAEPKKAESIQKDEYNFLPVQSNVIDIRSKLPINSQEKKSVRYKQAG
jgi:hypothetical protein